MEASYAEQNFGKSLTKIELVDLNRFFTVEREESDTLEFKSYAERGQNNHAHKEAGVLKTICAFLNSSGGLVIWGAPVGHTPDGRQNKIFTGELSPVTRLIEKDTFISRVANAIFPLSNLVRMHHVEVEPENYAYIFDVSQSTHRPHQFDNRYWVRSDGQTNIAPHYLIDALFKQVRYPNLGGYIAFKNCRLAGQNVLDLDLRIFLMNHSRNQNEHDVYFWITTSAGTFLVDNTLGVYDLDNHQYRRDDIAKILSYSHGPYQDLTLRINYSKLVNEQKESIPFEIMLTFGGKLSPMKRSDYTVTFQGLAGFSRNHPERIENMFTIYRKVNIAMDNLDISEEDRVATILSNQ